MRIARALAAALAALSLPAFVGGCDRNDDPLEKTMHTVTAADLTTLAESALRGGDAGRDARRRLDDLANWRRAFVDLRPVGAVLLPALADDDPAVRHRAVETIGRMALHTARGHSLGFLDRSPPAHVERPFFVDAVPAIAAACRGGDAGSRAACVASLGPIALVVSATADRDALAPLQAAASTAAADDDPAVAAAGRRVARDLEPARP